MDWKVQGLESACQRVGTFYRSIIVAEDGRVDIITDNNHESPSHQLQGLRPGLWRTFIRLEDGQPHAGAFWTIWICDGASKDLLEQMIGRHEVPNHQKEAAERQIAKVDKLDWQVDQSMGDAGGDYGIAIRSRHMLSSEFYHFLHETRIQEVQRESTVQEQWNRLPSTWRQTLEIWYDCNSGGDHMGGDEAGAQIGGAVIECESKGYRLSTAKNTQGQIIGILLGDMYEEGHNDSEEYDSVNHEEALIEVASLGLKPVTLECIHGGDPRLEQETANYIPTFHVTLEEHELLSNTSRAAAHHIIDHLLRNQSQYINPYINLSHMLDGHCNCQIKDDPKLPIVSIDADPTLWATLRQPLMSSMNASIMYHLPRMCHVRHAGLPRPDVPFYVPVTRSMRVEEGRKQGVLEWTAPSHWHKSLPPTLCPAEEYQLEPIFRYIGCGYAITPTSTYPPLIAAHIWRWTVESESESHTRDEVFSDPYGAIYQIGKQVKDARELLGHTALLITSKTKEKKRNRYFADIFAIDTDRGFLFGWLRDKDKSEDMCAFVLPGFSCEEDVKSLPPFRKVQVESFGFPQVIPSSEASSSSKSVPIICRQKATSSSPNFIPDFTIQVPCKKYEVNIDIWRQEILPSIGRRLIEHRLLHPLFMSYFEKAVESALLNSNERFPLQVTESKGQYWQAMGEYVARGQEPAEFGFIAEWQFKNIMHPNNWPPSKQLPILADRQQPAKEAWKAPVERGWLDPIEPAIDPTGKYQKIDVMSYVGCGHVLPPSTSYPPEKARFVWSRLSEDSQDSYKIQSPEYTIDAQNLDLNLLDFLGQTVMIDNWDVIDVIGVDQVRKIVFGFCRKSTPDTFLHFHFPSSKSGDEKSSSSLTISPTPTPSSSSQPFLDDPKIKSKDCKSIGLLIRRTPDPQPALSMIPTFGGGGHGFAFGNPSTCNCGRHH